jgi:D-glycero-D-manno-heptose 1,7-bisphosphate phosphatase
MMKPAVFLDRDGVLIENRPDYVRNWHDVAFYPQALAAMSRISRLPHSIILVTNQSAVGRGIISLDRAWAINQRIVEVISEAGGRIDRVYMCPHAPWDGCGCRKPKPGLFLQAASELSLDLNQSLMIGDALTDLVAAKAAGVPMVALVRTGRGDEQEQLPVAENLQPLAVYPDLSDALETIFLSQ